MDILRFLGHVIEDPVGIEEPSRFVNALHQNYPNPFNPITTVVFSLKEKAHVSLKIYNVVGQLVRILVNEERGPGEYDVIWKRRNDRGEPVASGVDFYRMVRKNFTDTKKMVIIK
ncbi:MAG: T9SS type A sorting domain-containing protein [Candidatus Latescibacteria bacterium]|nr:T9SS type A sorting domain-containing protein [Candidatus Latescibacterota bacterium]NIO55419.1 T9SS type A sorting domain-containing protein [Candidatus Latescibacterota bacterium]